MLAEVTLRLTAILENIADSASKSKTKAGKAFNKNFVVSQEWLSRLALWQMYIVKSYCKEIVEDGIIIFLYTQFHP